MVSRCCVLGCNRVKKSIKQSFFALPGKSPFRELWINELKLDAGNLKNSSKVSSLMIFIEIFNVVCWRHFNEDDYFCFSTTHRLKPRRVPKPDLVQEVEINNYMEVDESAPQSERTKKKIGKKVKRIKIPQPHCSPRRSPFLIENFCKNDKKN